MKKTLLSSLMVGAIALAAGSLFSMPSYAVCPLKKQPDSQCQNHAPFSQSDYECKKPMSPEERSKVREEKKEEFEARLRLTDEQKIQIEKIKKEEMKKLAPYKEKIKKEQQKIDKLFEEQKAIKKESLKKFEATLTEKQKEELNKIKEEVREEIKKMGPPKGPHGEMMGPCGPLHFDKKPCAPKCNCPCHKHAPMKPMPCPEPQAVK